MSEIGSYELGRLKGDDHFSIVRVYEVGSDPCEGPCEEFLLGEPVYLKTPPPSYYPAGKRSEPDATIWWIRNIREDGEAGCITVARTREGPDPGAVDVSPMKLEKLPEMVRLAVEYAF